MKNRISEHGSGEPDSEAALAYTIGPGKDGKESLMFVFQGTVEECREMFEQLYQKTAMITGPEEELEERAAKLIIMDNRGLENN